METLIFKKTRLKTENNFIKKGGAYEYFVTNNHSVIVKYLGGNNKLQHKSVGVSHDVEVNKNYMRALFKASGIGIEFIRKEKRETANG